MQQTFKEFDTIENLFNILYKFDLSDIQGSEYIIFSMYLACCKRLGTTEDK